MDPCFSFTVNNEQDLNSFSNVGGKEIYNGKGTIQKLHAWELQHEQFRTQGIMKRSLEEVDKMAQQVNVPVAKI